MDSKLRKLQHLILPQMLSLLDLQLLRMLQSAAIKKGGYIRASSAKNSVQVEMAGSKTTIQCSHPVCSMETPGSQISEEI